MLYTRREPLGRGLADYIADAFGYLHELTGDRCLMFVPSPARRHDDLDDRSDITVAQVVNQLDIPPTALPCAVFFVPQWGLQEQLILPLADAVEPSENGSYTDTELNRAMHAIAEAVDITPDRDPEDRLRALDRYLQALLPVSARPATAVLHDQDAERGSAREARWLGRVAAATGVLGALAALIPLL